MDGSQGSKFDKGVPLPGGPGRPTSKWKGMEVGDSRFEAGAIQSRTFGSAYAWGRVNGQRFSSRVVTENGIRGTRVWRIE